MSEAEYLSREPKASLRHEYINGTVVAMSGASTRHNVITARILRALGNRLDGGPREAMTSDQRVFVEKTRLYTYPDVVVVCGPTVEVAGVRPATITNPSVLFEVLSRSTEAYDRGAKWAHYRSLVTLREYVLVSQVERRVEAFRRADGDVWEFREFQGSALLPLPSLSVSVPLDEIYDRAMQYRGDDDSAAEG